MEPSNDLNIITLMCLLLLVTGALAGIVADFKNKAKKK